MEVSPGQALRDAIEDDTIMVVGAPNALAAKLIEQMGIGGIYLSGAALSAGVLALPDVGLFSLTELAQQATYLTRVIDTPLIVDADTGFGDIMNVERTIVELEAAGVAAIQLEDQQLPKRCGHLSGKSLVEPEAMCAKLQAAAAARRDDSLVLLARTDARGVTNLDDAIDRAKRYIDAGADWIFPEALTSAKEFERFAKAIDVPLVANMTEFGKSPLLTRDELADLGYAAVLYPVTLLRVAMKAMEAALALLATEGTQRGLLDLMQTRDELYELIEYEEFEQRDRQFFGGTGGSP
ncbi:MAG: methylisocitrate lyase [Planctomycetales bacterium]|nr:methylisocitrate lyase [Planctomycetales bacterium]